MEYVLYVIILINIYIILGTSFNLLIGYAGIFSIAHAAFYGIGAYTSALLALRLGWNFLATMAIGVIVAAVASLLLAIPSLRTKGIYIAITSFGFQIIVYSTFVNWLGLTQGPAGLTGIPRPQFFGITVASNQSFVFLTLLMAIATVLVVWRVTSMPFGRVLRAMREDEVATEALGKDVVRFKVLSFLVASSLAALAGSLYAHYMVYINPYSFTLEESLAILAVVIVGGSANLRGPIIGAIVLVSLPEVLRFLSVPDPIAAPVRQILYGGLLILFLRFRPQGLLGQYFGGAKL